MLWDCCERLLDITVASLDDPPPLQFVTVGDPTQMYDCPMVAVAVAANGLFPSINIRARGPSLPAFPTMKTSTTMATFAIWVITTDCWPTQTAEAGVPPAEAINAASLAVLTDQDDTWLGLRDNARNGTMFAGLMGGNDCAEVGPPSTYFGPSGNVAGSIFYVTANVLRLPGAS